MLTYPKQAVQKSVKSNVNKWQKVCSTCLMKLCNERFEDALMWPTVGMSYKHVNITARWLTTPIWSTRHHYHIRLYWQCQAFHLQTHCSRTRQQWHLAHIIISQGLMSIHKKTRTADIAVKNSHKNSANKNVFKSSLQCVWVCAWRIVSGSRFQAAHQTHAEHRCQTSWKLDLYFGEIATSVMNKWIKVAPNFGFGFGKFEIRPFFPNSDSPTCNIIINQYHATSLTDHNTGILYFW